MALNTLEYRTELTNELDKKLVHKSVIAALLDNSFGSKFVGTKTVLIPDVSFQGLGDYDRETGFPAGAVTVEHTPYTLTQERARRFAIDRMDMDEVGISGLAGQIMGEFQRTKVAPEMDAYGLSKLGGIAVDKGHTVEGTMASECVKILTNAIKEVQDVVGYDEELIAFVNSDFNSALMSTPELTRRLDIGDFKKGEINTRVRKLDNCVILPASNSSMMKSYTFNDGTSEGQKEGGFVPNGTDAFGCIVLPKKVAKLVKKLDKVRIFDPDKNINKDAYQFDYRIYYDLLVKKSEIDAIWAYEYTMA